MINTGLYIHIPFCRTKCPYCSFVSKPCADQPPDAYLETLQTQITAFSSHPWVREQRFQTMFLGGGTPTIYQGEKLASLVSHSLQHLPFDSDPEISVEANPNTVSKDKLLALRQAGVNRLSIGVQAMTPEMLAVLGRSHSVDDACRSFGVGREAGFGNINIDLIYGLPGQTVEHWQQTLQQALALQPEHLALYELTIEPGTVFAKQMAQGRLSLPDEEQIVAMEEMTVREAAAQGIQRYEISNYAKEGHQCRHNINYWQNGSYLGLGAGAVSCLDGRRVRNLADPEAYMESVANGQEPLENEESLSLEASFRETVIMGMRMTDGINLADLKDRYGLEPLAYYGETLTRHIERGAVIIEDDWMRLSQSALAVADFILADLV